MIMCQAIQDEDMVDDIILRGHLMEAIVKTMEDPETTRGNSPTPVAMIVFDTAGMPYSKAKAKAHGKGPRAVIGPPGHPEAPNAQASQSSQPVGEARVAVRTLKHVSAYSLPFGSLLQTDFFGIRQEGICLRQC